jgi:DNA-binding response OmpR family regulator
MMKKILIVDDEEDVRNLYKEVLVKVGYDVKVAVDGHDCLEKLRKETVDLVLMDMFMPGLSGKETFERMVKEKNFKSVKVAFLTVADIGEKGKAELTFMGAVDYIFKPIENEELVRRVGQILGGPN